MFKCLDIHKYSDLTFNPAISEFSEPLTNDIKTKQMKNIYPDAVKYLPPNSPPPRGNPIQDSCSVDSNHSGDKIISRYQSGIILHCNKSPIV